MSMEKPIISISEISKKYQLGSHASYDTLRDRMVSTATRLFHAKPKEQAEEFWALKDVTARIQAGERVGIIGRNGAGKSTLLKILSKITYPTSGSITIRGRVASLLEVGTGFHPELTGRENVFLNGAILGMTQREVRLKFDEIIDFSGMTKFVDTPVKRYSSGMYTRLAFAVAAFLESEILIVDEVLAVGDMEFQKKCLQQMRTAASKGRTVLFVSHNLGAISQLCDRTLLLQNGALIADGKTADVISTYFQTSHRAAVNVDLTDNSLRQNSLENSLVKWQRIRISNDAKQETDQFGLGETIVFTADLHARQDVQGVSLGIAVNTMTGLTVCSSTQLESGKSQSLNAGNHSVQFSIQPNLLAPGTYLLDISANGQGVTDWIPSALQFTITAASPKNKKTWPTNKYGFADLPISWDLNPKL